MKNLTISVALVALCAITVDAFAGGHAPPQQPATGVSSRSQAQAGAISGSAARATGVADENGDKAFDTEEFPAAPTLAGMQVVQIG